MATLKELIEDVQDKITALNTAATELAESVGTRTAEEVTEGYELMSAAISEVSKIAPPLQFNAFWTSYTNQIASSLDPSQVRTEYRDFLVVATELIEGLGHTTPPVDIGTFTTRIEAQMREVPDVIVGQIGQLTRPVGLVSLTDMCRDIAARRSDGSKDGGSLARGGPTDEIDDPLAEEEKELAQLEYDCSSWIEGLTIAATVLKWVGETFPMEVDVNGFVVVKIDISAVSIMSVFTGTIAAILELVVVGLEEEIRIARGALEMAS